MTNGSSHWILHQPDQVSKTDTMARGAGTGKTSEQTAKPCLVPRIIVL